MLLPGDALRNAAAELLQGRLGKAYLEYRANGKKADIYFVERHFGKISKTYVEAKDYKKCLGRDDVVKIWADYSGIIAKNAPAILLVVTRNGLTSDAQSYIEDEQPLMRHQTIREIENETLGLSEYVAYLGDEFSRDGLDKYYVNAQAFQVHYGSDKERSVSSEKIDIFSELLYSTNQSDRGPVAILGGYGAGKSSLARRIASYFACKSKHDFESRKPILIKLGLFTRYSSIEGLLGAMFTSDFPVPSFNFRIFENLNRSGRFIIILDGFDEMKHAMSWSDFRNQVKDLNRLIVGDAKVILLGRPSAFISFEEHIHVLKGVKRVGDGWRKEVDWPDFEEFELSNFDHYESIDFVERYLSFRISLVEGRPQDSENERKSRRINEVKSIMVRDHDLFGKPVHLKILCDLAADDSIDLVRFEESLTRWDLYEVFFNDLLERDSEKVARRELGPQARLTFLRELAYWLWTERGGQISFSADELPRSLIEQLNPREDEDADGLMRELLVGAFLEKKGGTISTLATGRLQNFWLLRESYFHLLLAERFRYIRELQRTGCVPFWKNTKMLRNLRP